MDKLKLGRGLSRKRKNILGGNFNVVENDRFTIMLKPGTSVMYRLKKHVVATEAAVQGPSLLGGGSAEEGAPGQGQAQGHPH